MGNKVYQIITDQIIELLEQGTVPWRQPWNGNRFPKNARSNRAYSGINPFILNHTALKQGYIDNRWLTVRQANQLGGRIIKGEKATMVVFWKPAKSRDENAGAGEAAHAEKNIPVLRYYNLFNVEQCQNLGLEPAAPPASGDHAPQQAAEQIVKSMPNPPKTIQGLKASYNYRADTVTIPPLHLFENAARYYSTYFHELVHSTRHPSRTGRDTKIPTNQNDRRYSKEELIAEMGAAMLCGTAGLSDQTLSASAAYIKSWLENLQNDPRMVIQAASKAQQAVNYILGLVSDHQPLVSEKESACNQAHGAVSNI